MSHCARDICFSFLHCQCFALHASATMFMCTKAQGYLLSLLSPIAEAESAVSVDKSEFIIVQGSRCRSFINGCEL